jgi:hypothetical protein
MVICLALLVIIFVRVVIVFPFVSQPVNSADIIEKFLGDIFSSLGVTAFLALMVMFLFPIEKSVEEVKRKPASDYFEKAYSFTGKWDFSGSSGTFIRASTLPQLHAVTGHKQKHVDVLILINDPRDLVICERYVGYKRTSGEEPWTVERVRLEIVATIIAAAWYGIVNPRLTIRVGLKSVLSRYRYDVSSAYAIVTRENPDEPALIVHSESVRYQGIIEEISCQRDQAEMLDLERLSHIRELRVANTLAHVTDAQVLAIVSELNLKKVLEECNDGDGKKLLHLVKHPKHRYA